MYGFETIGNATLIVHDGSPLLATDPWIEGTPYFGSWMLPYEIPPEQRASILACPYIWLSHGHPDHANGESLALLSGQTLLLPEHVGGRMTHELRGAGFKVRVLPTRAWVELSPRVRVMCLPDVNQDACLLVAMRDQLIVNLNDGNAIGYRRLLRSLATDFKRRFVLALNNYGDADMVNLWNERGEYLAPPAARKPDLGAQYGQLAKDFNATHLAPFSCFHAYQREDSAWAMRFATPLEAHAQGFDARIATLLPAFVQVDFERDVINTLEPREIEVTIRKASDFGDDWAEQLENEEFADCEKYFLRKEALRAHFGFVNLCVGKRTRQIVLNPKLKTGITFDAPRASLVAAIRYETFDDLLIGNFMKVTLHGGIKALYPDFSPVVAKYADNGRAQSSEELAAYLRAYRLESGLESQLAFPRRKLEAVFRRTFARNTPMFEVSKRAYRAVRRVL